MSSRKFETDYAGTWRGFCKSRETALLAAVRHLVNDGYTACTITDRETNQVIARVRMEKGRKTATITTVSPFNRGSI